VLGEKSVSTFKEWETLCGKYESAQDDYTAAYLAITARLFTGGADGRGPLPTAAEVARWDVARERLRVVDERMRAFVAQLRERSSEDPGARRRVNPASDPDLH
jgi:hypothetical protein